MIILEAKHQLAEYDSPEVLYFSAHQFPCYPGTGKLSEIGTGAGKRYTINIRAIRECGLRVLQELVDLPTLSPEKIRRMTPDKPDSLPELQKAMNLHRAFWPAIP